MYNHLIAIKLPACFSVASKLATAKRNLSPHFLYICNMPGHTSCVIHSKTITLSKTRPGHYAELKDTTASASSFSKGP